jgi:hypothetical protein
MTVILNVQPLNIFSVLLEFIIFPLIAVCSLS